MSRLFRLGRLALVVVLCLAAFFLALFLAGGALLAMPSEPPRRVDVVVVLGGSADSGRYERGRDLVQSGYSDRLVLIGASRDQLQDAREKISNVSVWSDVLVRNSWGEAQVTRNRMEAAGLRSVIVVSDPPHMLRLKYTWGSIFRGTNLEYVLVATAPQWWSDSRWWQDERAANFVRSEAVKLGYYVAKYRFNFLREGD